MQLSYAGNHVLISGGSSSLAMALAASLIEEGLHPILTVRSADGKAKIIQNLGEGSHYTVRDLCYGDENSLKELLHALPKELCYFIDFAHEDYESLIGGSDAVSVERYYRNNVSFRAELLRELSRLMILNREGRMIYISSSAVVRSNPGQGFYASSKLACEAIYRSIGIELGSKGITSVSLRLGYVDAGRGKKFIEHKNSQVMGKIPSKKLLTAEDVAKTIIYFMSRSSFGINATEILVDGGMCAAK